VVHPEGLGLAEPRGKLSVEPPGKAPMKAGKAAKAGA
jgi:hypothetical protein